jgi:hypothetical protein
MTILGVVLLALGLIFAIKLLVILGIILAVVGAGLLLLNALGHGTHRLF